MVNAGHAPVSVSLNSATEFNRRNDIGAVFGGGVEFKIKRVTVSEKRRQGIGVFQPSDPKTQDISDLVGSIDLSTIGEFGSESDKGCQKVAYN